MLLVAVAFRKLASLVLSVVVGACASNPTGADPRSDAPEQRVGAAADFKSAASYAQALQAWQTPEDVNAWIGTRFEYDPDRSLRLSETQRMQQAGPPIHTPVDFFASPRGVCVDLSRFGVETLRTIAPALKTRYLMIEFDPVEIQGQVLRRHWVASFERDGQFFFADSKRPGFMAGPYASTQQFVDEYARYRGRRIVSFRELDSFSRRAKTPVARSPRETAA